MGGHIAVTVRFSDGKEWRNSCWTNIVPNGLFDAPFYDLKTSEEHVRAWTENIVKRRKEDKSGQLEELWGNHSKLSPGEYGIVVLDYQKDWYISANGYTSADRIFLQGSESYDIQKFSKLQEMGKIEGIYQYDRKLDKEVLVSKKVLTRCTELSKKIVAYNDAHESWNLYAPEFKDRPAFEWPRERYIARVKLPFKNVIESLEGVAPEAFKVIRGLFKLSKTELSDWNKWIKRN